MIFFGSLRRPRVETLAIRRHKADFPALGLVKSAKVSYDPRSQEGDCKSQLRCHKGRRHSFLERGSPRKKRQSARKSGLRPNLDDDVPWKEKSSSKPGESTLAHAGACV